MRFLSILFGVIVLVGWGTLSWSDDPKKADAKQIQKTLTQAKQAITERRYHVAEQQLAPLLLYEQPGALVVRAVMLSNGWGHPKDPIQAARLYTQASKQGCLLAIYHLGNAYSHGVGVSLDLIKAWGLYGIAASEIPAANRFQRLLEKNFNDEDLSEARKQQEMFRQTIQEGDAPSDRVGCSEVKFQ